MHTCPQRGCTGHLGKFDSCRDEALYEMAASSADGTAGDTDWEGHYAYLRLPNGEEFSEEWVAGGETVTVPAGFYIVFTSPSGWVSATRYAHEDNAREVFESIEARYMEWEDS